VLQIIRECHVYTIRVAATVLDRGTQFLQAILKVRYNQEGVRALEIARRRRDLALNSGEFCLPSQPDSILGHDDLLWCTAQPIEKTHGRLSRSRSEIAHSARISHSLSGPIIDLGKSRVPWQHGCNGPAKNETPHDLSRLRQIRMLSPFVRENLSRLQLAKNNTADPRSSTRVPRRFDVDSLQGIECENEQGRYWHVERPLRSLWSEVDECLRAHRTGCASALDATADRNGMAALSRCFPQATFYLDLETCGFSGSAIFLIGTLHWRDNEWILTQLLARDYSEESAILQALDGLLAGQSVLVTFNGKSFDGPMLEDRQTLHRLPRSVAQLAHCDLLHLARRRWRDQVPDCRLQTLEQHVCQRQRRGDLPGQLVPAAYHDFVRTGETRQVREILHHNLLDLITLLQLSAALLTDVARAR
jgi:uncharacterized protein YprB with RNaseH-like and TPR domain